MWGVWLDTAFYFSTGSLAAQNLAARPAITVHLESGNEVVIIEGMAETVGDFALVERVVNLCDISPGLKAGDSHPHEWAFLLRWRLPPEHRVVRLVLHRLHRHWLSASPAVASRVS